MVSTSWIVVGGRDLPPAAPALLERALRAGLHVHRAALGPPEGDGWHRLSTPGRPSTLLAGAVQHLARRLMRGEDAELRDVLAADPWLPARVADAGSAPGEGEPTCLLVGLDDLATRALAAWRAGQQPGSSATSHVQVLTWDQAVPRLVEEILGTAPTTMARGSVGDAGPDPGAMVRVAVATTPGGTPREQLLDLVPRLRARVVPVDPGAPVPSRTDVLVLDGLGPAVAELDLLPSGVSVVHLPRPTDRSSPWTPLLVAERDQARLRVAMLGQEVDDTTLAEALVGADTLRLVGLRHAGRDDEALDLARGLLHEPSTDGPTGGLVGSSGRTTLREIVYLARVTGTPTLELAALRRQQESPCTATSPARLDQAVARVEDRLRETDPSWLPPLPSTPLEPVPGRVVHLLKIVLPQRQAGYSVRGHHTLAALADLGTDVVGLAMPPAASPDPGATAIPAAPPEETVVDGVRYLIPAPVPTDGPGGHLQAAADALLPVLAELRPAVLHVHSGHRGYDLGVIGAALAEATGVPWVYEVRGLFESTWTADPGRAERGELFERRREREADLVRRADATITLAETMRSDLVERGVPPEKVHVVPNAVDPARLTPVDRDEALVRQLDGAGRFTFGYVSNLDHDREQVEDLIRAAILLHSRGRPVHALVVGTGRREEELRALTHELGATGLVTFTGRVPHHQVAHYYGLLDVLVVPRSDERAARLVTPLKPFEAMAMGVPVVVSAQPALLEVIGDGERGWSYPSGDVEALADLLESLAADPPGRAEKAELARAWVTTERTWAANARACADLYATLGQTDHPDPGPGPR